MEMQEEMKSARKDKQVTLCLLTFESNNNDVFKIVFKIQVELEYTTTIE